MKAVIERIVLVSLIGQVLLVGGCYNCAASLRRAMTECKVERTVYADFVSGSKLVVRDCHGNISVSAGDVTDCRVAATVFVHAPTKSEAREIGEQVQIATEPNDEILVIIVKKPPMPQEHRFVSADLDIQVPRRAHLDCETDFGRITLTGIEGDVKATTQLGSVICENMQGSLRLETQLGRIIGREIVSDHIVAKSQKGSIDVSCADSCPADIMADVRTQWGDVHFKAPPQYEGTVKIATELGSVWLDIPADVRGKIENTIFHDKVSGRIGSGEGSLRLFTNLGSVQLR